MASPAAPWVGLAVAVALVFAVVTLIGLRIMPEPHKDTDYLVIGSLATLISLSLLFVVLIFTWLKSPGILFKRRAKGPPEQAR